MSDNPLEFEDPVTWWIDYYRDILGKQNVRSLSRNAQHISNGQSLVKEGTNNEVASSNTSLPFLDSSETESEMYGDLGLSNRVTRSKEKSGKPTSAIQGETSQTRFSGKRKPSPQKKRSSNSSSLDSSWNYLLFDDSHSLPSSPCVDKRRRLRTISAEHSFFWSDSEDDCEEISDGDDSEFGDQPSECEMTEIPDLSCDEEENWLIYTYTHQQSNQKRKHNRRTKQRDQRED